VPPNKLNRRCHRRHHPPYIIIHHIAVALLLMAMPMPMSSSGYQYSCLLLFVRSATGNSSPTPMTWPNDEDELIDRWC